MKTRSSLSLLRLSWLGASLLCAPIAVFAECEKQYFSIDQNGVEHPSARPSAALAKTIEQAKAGDGAAQRSLAISYESGYLVSPCRAQSVRWYRASAESGDDVAIQWLRKDEAITAFRSGPECGETSCLRTANGETSTAVLHADASHNNHYFAPVTINGKTTRGMIDTGASTISMSAEIARMYGIDSIKGKAARSSTANGQIPITLIVLPRVEVAGIELRNVAVSVGISDGLLIGMSFLSRMNITVDSGTMTLSRK